MIHKPRSHHPACYLTGLGGHAYLYSKMRSETAAGTQRLPSAHGLRGRLSCLLGLPAAQARIRRRKHKQRGRSEEGVRPFGVRIWQSAWCPPSLSPPGYSQTMLRRVAGATTRGIFVSGRATTGRCEIDCILVAAGRSSHGQSWAAPHVPPSIRCGAGAMVPVGQDVERRLPILATFLGHVRIALVFIHLPRVDGAGRRFEDYWEKQS